MLQCCEILFLSPLLSLLIYEPLHRLFIGDSHFNFAVSARLIASLKSFPRVRTENACYFRSVASRIYTLYTLNVGRDVYFNEKLSVKKSFFVNSIYIIRTKIETLSACFFLSSSSFPGGKKKAGLSSM